MLDDGKHTVGTEVPCVEMRQEKRHLSSILS